MAEVICVAGPTACGKTGLAISLAKAYNGEVVSCDSMQIYRGMDIGTAKPTAQEMESVPHHMLDVADPAEDFSVSQYVAMADRAVQDILSRGKTAVIAGGTGLYMDSLIAGREFAPFPQDGRRQKLEAEADEKGTEPMLERLRQVDPQTAERLHPSDRKRILRALEVYEQTGKPLSWYNAQSRQQPPKYRPVWIGIDYVNRQTLYDRINRRVDEMLCRGLVEEVQRLLSAGVPSRSTALQAIGYKEIVRALEGQITLEQAVEQIKQGSRRYAKRQRTWFRRNDQMHWILRQDNEDIFPKAAEILSVST
ncbi:MAG: tRNA (adenosine(37)-N6)-dimethylallyltransferase MiaA [Candidatus Faecousia sp.]|nr:tRNA (adenosine(37)-N6)-dimethylallyltransferase MiaA [Candidatus Faecousia sp.]